jgi:putative MATE family efflux protein
VGAVANIGLNLLLVYGLDLGIAGSAAGTVIAQLGMAVALTAVVVREATRYGVSGRPHLAGIRAAGVVGVPLLVRTLTLRAALLVTTFVAASVGTAAVAAHQVAFTIWTLLALALDAVAIAGQAIVGRYLGAADVAGARSSTRRMMQWGLTAGVALGVLTVAARPLVVPLFTPDPDVQQLLADVLLVAALFMPVCGVVFALDGVLIGAGDGRYLAAAGVATLVAYLPLAGVVLATNGGLVALWWAFSGFLVARLVTLLWREHGDAWLVTGAALPSRR